VTGYTKLYVQQSVLTIRCRWVRNGVVKTNAVETHDLHLWLN